MCDELQERELVPSKSFGSDPAGDVRTLNGKCYRELDEYIRMSIQNCLSGGDEYLLVLISLLWLK